jgi:hypothetical protein
MEERNNSTSGITYMLVDLQGSAGYIFHGVKPGTPLVCLPEFVKFPNGRWRQLLHKALVGRLPLSGRTLEKLTGREGFSALHTLLPGDRLVLTDVRNLRTLKAVRRIVPQGVRLYDYFCDPVSYLFHGRDAVEELAHIESMGYRIVSFDPVDAQRYGLSPSEQYFRYPDAEEALPAEHDFFFCGIPKDRETALTELRRQLEAEGFACKFVIPHSRDEIMPYRLYIDCLRRSRCLVDWVQQGQTGLTRRPLEALFFGKKLITNNADIVNYPFYQPENILVLDGTDKADIQGFMKTPCVTVDDAIKQRYDVNTWLKNFE